jgi:ATP-binding cassette subfamily B protein
VNSPVESPRQRLISLRGLLPFLRPHRKLLLCWLVALAVSSAASLTLPVAFRHMVDQGFSHAESINRGFSGLFLVACVLALGTGARFFFVSLLGERVIADLRRQL